MSKKNTESKLTTFQALSISFKTCYWEPSMYTSATWFNFLDATPSIKKGSYRQQWVSKTFVLRTFVFWKKKLKTFMILKIHVLYPGVKISFFSGKMKTNFFVILMNQIFLLSNWSRSNNWKLSKVRKNQLLSGIPSLNVATYADINPTWIRTFVPKNLRIGRNEKICFPWRINFLLRELEKVVIWSVR